IRAKTLHAAGYLARALYDRAAASVLLEESLALYRELGDEPRSTVVMIDLGWTLATSAADTQWATTLLEEGLARARALGDQRRVAWALQGLGWVAQRHALGDRRIVVGPLQSFVWTERQRGSLDAARALY